MDSSTHQNNMQFDKFYRDVSRFTTNSILAIIGLLFIAISSVFLLVSYWCLTGSEYIETFKRDYERQYDYVNIQETLIDFMKASKDKIYYYLNMFYEHNLCINKEEKDSSDTEVEDSSDTEMEDSSDTEVEDITDQIILEKEMNKIIVDLSTENSIHTPETLTELGANVMEDIMAEMKPTEVIEKKECIEEDADADDTEDDDTEDDDTEDDDTEDAVDGDTDEENDDTENAADAENDDTENAADAENDDTEDADEEKEVVYYEPYERTLRSTKKRGN